MVAQCDPANGARHQKGGRSPLLGETALSQPKQREPQPPLLSREPPLTRCIKSKGVHG